MKTIKKFRISSLMLLALLGISVVLTSCKKDDDDEQNDMPPVESNSIVDIATSDNQFSILVDALTKAELVSTLDGDGEFTVFAPTNDAFEMLFDDLGVSGISDLSKEALTPILLYHVIGSEAKSSSLATGYVSTLSAATPDNQGMVIYINTDMGVKLNSSVTVTTADIDADNGVVHVIDKVLLPPTVVDIAIQNPDFSSLTAAVVKAGLVDALMAEGPFTVFAPTNDAFDMLFEDLGVSGLDNLSAADLTPILLYHVVPDNVLSSEVASGSVPTLNENSNIEIMVSDMGVKLNGSSNVIAVDVQGSNGVVHVIDKVILP